MSSERGIFDGDLPVSLTTIFDGGGVIFDTETSLPTARDPIFIPFPDHTEELPIPFHGTESIILR